VAAVVAAAVGQVAMEEAPSLPQLVVSSYYLLHLSPNARDLWAV
jgi:hypothetical protein